MAPQIHIPRKPSSAISFHCAIKVAAYMRASDHANGARIRQAKVQRKAASVHGGTVSTASRPKIRFDAKKSGMTARMARSRTRVFMSACPESEVSAKGETLSVKHGRTA